MKEIWKNVKGYEGLYQVSNKGRVKSLARNAKCGDNRFRRKKEILLKNSIRNTGYLYVCLLKNGKRKPMLIHRLVANAFIPTNNNRLQVNHKNLNKTDNSLNNLEWCTAYENIQHAKYANTRNFWGRTEKSYIHIYRKIVYCFEDELVFKNISECARFYKTNRQNISRCIKNPVSKYKGLHFCNYYKLKISQENIMNHISKYGEKKNHELTSIGVPKESKNLIKEHSRKTGIKQWKIAEEAIYEYLKITNIRQTKNA